MVKICEAKNGSLTVSKDGRFLLSRYDPVHEVARYIDRTGAGLNNHFIIFGSALGYVVKALLDKGVGKDDLIVYEPDAVLRDFFEKKYPDVTLLKDEMNLSGRMEKKLLEQKKPFFVCLDSFRKAYQKDYDNFTEAVRNSLRIAVENIKVSSYFSKVWFMNYIRNLTGAEKNQNTSVLRKPFRKIDMPVLVAAAGPSLNGCLEQIGKNQGGMIIISVLSAAHTLLNYGIKPDFIIMSDAGVYNKIHGYGIPEDIPVLSSVYGSSSLLESLKNPVVFYDLEEETGDPGFMLGNPSVTIDAGILAGSLSKMVIFAGFDLSYSQTEGSHSSGNSFYERKRSLANRFQTIDSYLTAFFKRADLTVLIENSLYTQSQFMLVKKLAEQYFKGYYYLGGGAGFESLIRLNDLAGFCKKTSAKAVSIDGIKDLFARGNEILVKISAALKKTESDLKDGGQGLCSRVFVREAVSSMPLDDVVRSYQDKISRLVS